MAPREILRNIRQIELRARQFVSELMVARFCSVFRHLDEMDHCLEEIAAIRRDMLKTGAEIRRLQKSTRRKLSYIRANLRA
jgi:hypothetical protein